MLNVLSILLLCAVVTAGSIEEAQQAVQAENYEQAVELYRQVLRAEPDSYDARFGLARALAFSKQYDQAIAIYKDLLEENPQNMDVLLSRGLIYSWNQQHDLAERDLKRVIERQPDYVEAWSMLGNLYRWSGRMMDATHAYTRWVELDPDNPAAYAARAHVYLETGQGELLRQDIESARALGASEAQLPQVEGTAPEFATPLHRSVEPSVAVTEPELGTPEVTYSWQLSTYYTYQALSSGQSDWHTYGTQLQYRFAGGSIAVDGFQTQRFSGVDEAVAFDGYLNLWPSAYGNVRMQIASDADFLPRTDFYAELFQGFGEGWEISGNFRHMDFASNNVDVYGFSLGKYIDRFYLRGRMHFTPESDETNIAYGLSIRYYLNDDDFIEASGGLGEETTVIGTGPLIVSSDTEFTALQYQNFLTERIGISLGYLYNRVDGAWESHGAAARIIFRW